MEVWKDIPNYEGLYQASNTGLIRSIEGKTTYSVLHGVRHWKSRVMKPRGSGRKIVALWKDGKAKDCYIHNLVAITFLGQPPRKGMTVNHKDGNPENNCVDNLEWLTLADNIRHGFKTGLYPQKRIRVMRNGKEYEFVSYASLDRFLNQRIGYTSCAIKNNRKIKDHDGNGYERVE